MKKSSEESDNESEDNDNSQPPGLNIGEIVKKRPTTTLQNETKADDQVTQVSKQDDRPDNVSLLRLLDLGEPRSFAIGYEIDLTITCVIAFYSKQASSEKSRDSVHYQEIQRDFS